MIAGLGLMLVANGSVCLASHALLRRVRTGEESLDATLFLLLRLLLISGFVLVCGLLRILTPWGLGGLGALILAGLLVAGEHRALPRWTRPQLTGLHVFMAIVVLRLLLQVWFFAPYSGDALTYHLPKVAEWIRAGAFTREHGADSRSTFPAGFELIETWWVAFLHHDVLIEMAGMEFFALMVVATRAMAVRLGMTTPSANLAAIIAACTPAMLLQATSCLNDGPVAALLTATAALVLARVHPALLVVPVALGVGIKPVFGYAFPGLLLLYAFGRRDPATPIERPRVAVAAAVGAVLVGVYWYARNTVLFGNPVYPITSRGFVTPHGDVIQRVGMDAGDFVQSLRRIVENRIYDLDNPYTSYLMFITGWGPLLFACGVPSLLLLLRTEDRWRKLAAAYAVGFGTILLMVRSDPWFMRFAIFFSVLPALAIARASESYRFLRVLGAICLVLQVAFTTVPADMNLGDPGFMVGRSWRERRLPLFSSDQPLSGKVGSLVPGSGQTYRLYGPDFSCEVVTIRPDGPDDLLVRMREAGVRRIYVPMKTSDIRLLVRQGRLKALMGGFFEVR